MAVLDFPPSPLTGDKYPVPAVAGQPQYTFDGAKWTTVGAQITTAKAADAAPLMDAATAAIGTATDYAREDHVHPMIPAVRYDAQTLTTPQQSQARANIGASIGVIGIQTFVANGTYTPTPGMTTCVIECVGGGGGGGGSQPNTPPGMCGGGGGGGGGYARLFATAATIGASKAVVIGAWGGQGTGALAKGGDGGDTTFGGTLCVAKGGKGGGRSTDGVPGSYGMGGLQGTGNLTYEGQRGGVGRNAVTTSNSFPYLGGGGGSSAFGFGAPPTHPDGDGTPGTFYGGGGSGGCAINTERWGGLGGLGLCVITEYGM